MLDEESKHLVTVNTQKGLFHFNQLPFGVSSAPVIFHKIMEGILKGITGVNIYLDDILITGKSEEQPLANLEWALKQLEVSSMWLKYDKITLFEYDRSNLLT